MITKYGYDVFFTVVIICLAAIVLSWLFLEPKFLKYGIPGVAFIVLVLTVNFFRDPDRSTPPGQSLIVSPADGKIIAVRQVEEKEYVGSKATLVSIFMSPLNVHVNRTPITGTVRYLRYVEGEYFAAFEDKASEKNEQMVIGIENERGRVLFKQIAGFVARRIVCKLTMGQPVKAGERFGMIKFGSRVDVFIPAQSVVRAKVGDVTVAGETVLAELQ
jgi:phosphatidylserine decarboxylase